MEAHSGLCAASAEIAAPSPPDGPPDAVRCLQEFVAGDTTEGVGFLRFGVPVGWYDHCGATGRNAIIALAGVEPAVGGDSGDLFLRRVLIEQHGQHERPARVMAVNSAAQITSVYSRLQMLMLRQTLHPVPACLRAATPLCL